MKILILSANTGQGHNSCAMALQDAFRSRGDECDIQDVFGLVSEKLSRMISLNHERTYRKSPAKSDAEYRYLEAHPGLFAPGRLIYRVMSTGRGKVEKCVRQGGYDGVLCTHVLAAMTLTAALQKGDLPVKSGFVSTDYSCCPGVNGTSLDRYFIPHEALIADFLKAQVPPEKLRVTGIPVSSRFAPTVDKAAAKAAFGIDPGKRHLLMACGSMGCGPIPQMLRILAADLPGDWEISILCGTNGELKAALEQEHASRPNIHVRGFEKNVPLLLSGADLFLTKPGGLSTSEAAAAAVPMVLVDAVAGCEAGNLHHFVRQGAAVTGDTPEKVAAACLSLMSDPARLHTMTRTLRACAHGCAAKRIAAEMGEGE